MIPEFLVKLQKKSSRYKFLENFSRCVVGWEYFSDCSSSYPKNHDFQIHWSISVSKYPLSMNSLNLNGYLFGNTVCIELHEKCKNVHIHILLTVCIGYYFLAFKKITRPSFIYYIVYIFFRGPANDFGGYIFIIVYEFFLHTLSS